VLALAGYCCRDSSSERLFSDVFVVNLGVLMEVVVDDTSIRWHGNPTTYNNRAFHAAIMCQLSVQLPSSATAQAP
jgi:hypothetical protein